MSSLGEVATTLGELVRILPLLTMKPPKDDAAVSLGGLLEANARRHAGRPMITFEGRDLTWSEFNALVNRYCHVLKDHAVRRHAVVSVLMDNRIEQLAAVFACWKLGATASLVNTSLSGRQLAHCITTAESNACIVGEELIEPLEAVKAGLGLKEGEDYLYLADRAGKPAPSWAIDLGGEAAAAPDSDPVETAAVLAGDTCLYIFTSGTTGLPKAAVVSHRRFMGNANIMARAGFRARPSDRMYICLPLYHATGLMLGVGSCLVSGASMFVRRRFSASGFLSEARAQNTNLFIYIGELCRYLMNQPARPDDADNPITRMLGNGLRPDIWKPFKRRFGIERVCEFYGASEGNAGFVNLLNKDETVGMTIYDVALIDYDVDADEIIRGADGRCRRVARGDAGLLISRIDEKARFEGYTNPEATSKKILRDVFEPGDAWFNSGDLLRQVDVGFSMGLAHYQFVDRVGDTFRWKGENVSTNEVAEIINSHPDIEYCNVFGVEIPGADGRAGMAAVKPRRDDLDIESVSRHIVTALPGYARPVFLRVQSDLEMTGTFKLVKGQLREQGYDVTRINDAIYVLKPGETRYTRLDEAFLDAIRSGDAGY